MLFTKDAVKEACKRVAPAEHLDWKLVYALCLQESAKEDGQFNPSVARLEPGYYRRYTEVLNDCSTNEALYAISWGVMQMMGLSLKDAKYFEWYYSQQTPAVQVFLGNPLSEIAVPKALNFYCVNLDVMILFGCRWFNKKLKLGGTVEKALGYWNGDRTGKYAKEVLSRLKDIGE